MKKGLLATLLALTSTVLFPGERRQRQPQHYRALPKTTGEAVVKTPPMSEADMKRVKERHRQRKAKRGF